MRWTGEIKPTNIELPEDLHNAMKSEAPKRQMTVKVAYREAATAWIDAAPGSKLGEPSGAKLSPLMEKLRFVEAHAEEDMKTMVSTAVEVAYKRAVSKTKHNTANKGA